MQPVQRESGPNNGESTASRTARLVLTTFVLTFLVARITVLLIMLRVIPDIYVHVGQTHVHHLNYGIFLLAGTGAYLLFAHPVGRQRSAIAVVYGVGLALTFDEFGMWLHLGSEYWQRASFDAVVVIAGLLALLAYAPSVKRLKPQHWGTAAVLLLTLAAFGMLLTRSLLLYAGRVIGPRLHALDALSPP